MTDPINQEHEEVLNFAHSLPSGLTKEQIYVRIHERAKSAASADQAAGVVPAGWKLVPIEPTDEMVKKFAEYDVFDCVRQFPSAVKHIATSMWEQVCAAAPQPQAVQQPAEQAAAVAESQPAAANPYSDYRATYWQAGFEGKEICAPTRGHALAAYSDGIKSRAAPQASVPAASEGWVSVDERRPTDTKKKYWVASNWGVRMAHLHVPEWAKGEFQDALTDSDEGMDDWDRSKRPFTVTHWQELIFPAAPATCDKAEG
jgi:hypothetical protein